MLKTGASGFVGQGDFKCQIHPAGTSSECRLDQISTVGGQQEQQIGVLRPSIWLSSSKWNPCVANRHRALQIACVGKTKRGRSHGKGAIALRPRPASSFAAWGPAC